MSLMRIDYNPSRGQLAVFGAVWLVFFGALGGVIDGRGGPRGLAAAAWLAAIVVPSIGWLVPRFMRLVYLGMALLAFPVGLVVSYVVLAAVYYLVFAPIGLLMRLFGYDPLKRRFDRAAESYWVARRAAVDLRRYFRQF
jgi:fatty acid desaturase